MLLAHLSVCGWGGHVCSQTRLAPRVQQWGVRACASLKEDEVFRCLSRLLEERGRCSLSEAGEWLRGEDVALPEGLSLSTLVESHPELTLSGRPSSRRVSLAGRSTEDALVRLVSSALHEHGALSTVELKLRLSERGRFVPGLLKLIRSHPDTFIVEAGVVGLTGMAEDLSQGSLGSLGSPMLRLQALGLSGDMAETALPPAGQVEEVLLLDLDNHAFVLEPVVRRAVAHGGRGSLLLGFCSTQHNPRVSSGAAEQMQELAARGWLKIIMPERDTKNAADFVMSFYVGWLHSWLPISARFVMFSTDIHLDRTVVDLLRALGREALSNPDFLRSEAVQQKE